MPDIPLEEGDPLQPEPQEPATPAEPAQPAQLGADDADLDQHVIEVPQNALPQQKAKVVPLTALQQERQARRDAVNAAKAAEEKLAQINQAIAQARQQAALQQQQQQTQPQTPAGPTPEDDADARDYAEAHGLYDPQGNLAIERARKALEIEERRLTKRVEQRVEQQVGPVRQSAALTQAQNIRQAMYSVKDDKGRPMATKAAIDMLTNNIPPDVLAQPGVAQWVLMTARGMDPSVLTPAPETPEPLYTEAPGGRRPGYAPPSVIEKHAMQQRGVTDAKTWQKLSDTSDLTLE